MTEMEHFIRKVWIKSVQVGLVRRVDGRLEVKSAYTVHLEDGLWFTQLKFLRVSTILHII